MLNNNEKTDLLKEFESVTEYWSPKIIKELNGQYIKVAKLKGEFVWHDHEFEDELFYVLKGQLSIKLENETVTLNEHEMYVVPKKIKHFPSCKEEVWVMLIEPKSTKHTGDIVTERTKSVNEQIQ